MWFKMPSQHLGEPFFHKRDIRGASEKYPDFPCKSKEEMTVVRSFIFLCSLKHGWLSCRDSARLSHCGSFHSQSMKVFSELLVSRLFSKIGLTLEFSLGHWVIGNGFA